MTPALLPWPTDASPSARIACSRRSESGRGAKKSEHEKTAGDIVGVGSEAGGGGRNPPHSRFSPSASSFLGIIQNINKIKKG